MKGVNEVESAPGTLRAHVKLARQHYGASLVACLRCAASSLRRSCRSNGWAAAQCGHALRSLRTCSCRNSSSVKHMVHSTTPR